MTNFSCGSLEVQCSCTDFDLDTAPKAKKAENEATLDPFPCLSVGAVAVVHLGSSGTERG